MITLFDTETTDKYNFNRPATDPCQPHLVQLAAIHTNLAGNILGQLNFIVEPDGWKITPASTKIHRISHRMAVEHGMPIKVVLAAFNHFCRHSDCIVAHNINFDHSVMLTNYHRHKIPHRMDGLLQVCTMKIATPIVQLPKQWKDPADPYKWPTLSETNWFFFNEDISGAHNAMVDTIALANVFFELLKRKHIKMNQIRHRRN